MDQWKREHWGKVTYNTRDFPTGIFYCGSIISYIYGPAKTQFSQHKILALGHACIPTHSASKIIHSMKVNIDGDIFADKKYIYKILLLKNIFTHQYFTARYGYIRMFWRHAIYERNSVTSTYFTARHANCPVKTLPGQDCQPPRVVSTS